jgi:hypothetical protein
MYTPAFISSNSDYFRGPLSLKYFQTSVWHWSEGDDFFLQEVKSMSLSDECSVCAVAPVHLMETYRGCVIRFALSHDFILIFVVGIMHRKGA